MAKNEHSKADTLISFESGHYKKVKSGQWLGDSVWMHIKKADGGVVHVNKDKVEYVETWEAIKENAIARSPITPNEAKLREENIQLSRVIETLKQQKGE